MGSCRKKLSVTIMVVSSPSHAVDANWTGGKLHIELVSCSISFLTPCSSLQHEEMIICCKPRNINVFFSLLMILAELGSNCNFEYDPISSPDNYKEKINDLRKYLISDYPVEDSSNSLLDSRCSPLWELFYIYTELRAIEKKSGSVLAEKIRLVLNEFKFVEECSFNKSDIPAPQYKPITFILDRTIHLLDQLKLKRKIVNDYSNCTLIQYRPDDSPKTALNEADKFIEQPSHRVRYGIIGVITVFIISLITNEATG
ncbi:fms-related tyrosine kinase 3 ligand isoform X2 [Pseudophryne corroboree]|uniref:fms-related tyrosine kinase 3 ligand isoform X2 n=1 Tax=Pseudophryne corroboree TaxID=495146 RepID=UPI0030820BD3